MGVRDCTVSERLLLPDAVPEVSLGGMGNEV